MYYNEDDQRFKQPFGAVRTGQPVRFRIQPQSPCRSALLSVHEDGQGRPSLYAMQPIDNGFFEVTRTFDRPGLYFYGFVVSDEMDAPQGGRSDQPAVARSGDHYQLTVYDKDYTQPRGWAGGIMYQIFPDRFNIGDGKVLPTLFNDRVLHADLRDTPNFRPDADGRVRNNDYFGGNLLGIEQKLGYLKELGVTCIYLNPIGEAHSNHRYDTANYKCVDPLLGTDEDFSRLCQKAREAGIAIILDGVYSHTGDDSVYFNKYGRYDSLGAYQSELSSYYSWYTFDEHPDRYKSWWGFDTLPELNEHDPEFIEFICGEHGVIDHWMSLGASGFRLDVADELPDDFIEKIRAAVKRHGEDKILIGEVWEDASNKFSYGVRRRYLLGQELDAVMNYPFRTAILDFVRDGDAAMFTARVMGIVRNYPKPMLDLMMNLLSTHDTERAITSLAAGEHGDKDREWQNAFSLQQGDYLRGVEMLKLAMALQFTLPGIPCVYYGDEIGMQGMRDPFNRGFMRWDDADKNLLSFTRELAAVRREHAVFTDGEFMPLAAPGGVAAYLRRNEHQTVAVAVNRSDQMQTITLPNGKDRNIEPWRHFIEEL